MGLQRMGALRFSHWISNEFDIYTGKKREPELGLKETVALDLTKKLTGKGTAIYTDNYFSSPTLDVRLLNREFTDDKEMGRGDHEMCFFLQR